MAFLNYELVGPLGKAEDYNDIMKEIVDYNTENVHTKSVLAKDQKYVIKIERNMILPVQQIIGTLSELSLPIYITNDGHKCHFKDVVIKLTKRALERDCIIKDDEEYEEDPALATEW